MLVPESHARYLPCLATLLALALFPLCTHAGSPSLTDPATWRDYQVIMWQPQTTAQWNELKALGVTAGAVTLPDRDHPALQPRAEMAPLISNHLRWYVENIATDFYAAYHRWFPDRPVNWRFQEIKNLFRRDPADPRVFWRDPSLSDSRWLNIIRYRLSKVVVAQRHHRPLFYNLGDETGIADLSIFWDFDRSPASLAGMRRWLKGQYSTLAALNREWNTNFQDWQAVQPVTTEEAMASPDENYAAWSDFEAWMDISFARALRAGTDAVHRADPAAKAGIEGAQVPGWGGYDYSLISDAVDVMEMNDGGANIELARSLNPKLIILTTDAGVGSSAQEIYNIWREALRGARGIILWDPDSQFVAKNGSLESRAIDLRETFQNLRNGLGALLINSKRDYSPIGILYSPESMRVQWMLDWKPRGNAWQTREVADSYEDPNAVRDSMVAYLNTLESAGFHPQLISRRSIERNDLQSRGYKLIVLPRVLALSKKAADRLQAFARHGGAVVADTEPGLFDEHGRKLSHPTLSALFPTSASMESRKIAAPAMALYKVPTFEPDEQGWEEFLSRYDLHPTVDVTTSIGTKTIALDKYEFRNGSVHILALQRNRWSANGNRVRPSPGGGGGEKVTLRLSKAAFAYDVLRGRNFGYGRTFELDVDPAKPTIVAYSDRELTTPIMRGPRKLHRGQTGVFSLRFSAGRRLERCLVLHVDVRDPRGQIISHYSRNIITTGPAPKFVLHLGKRDAVGTWEIRITDPLTQKRESFAVHVVS